MSAAEQTELFAPADELYLWEFVPNEQDSARPVAVVDLDDAPSRIGVTR